MTKLMISIWTIAMYRRMYYKPMCFHLSRVKCTSRVCKRHNAGHRLLWWTLDENVNMLLKISEVKRKFTYNRMRLIKEYKCGNGKPKQVFSLTLYGCWTSNLVGSTIFERSCHGIHFNDRFVRELYFQRNITNWCDENDVTCQYVSIETINATTMKTIMTTTY